MKTGEGKTLTATLAVYLNALSGKGVHVITVNDYLAKRDAEWMGHVYAYLGLTTGCIIHGLSDPERQAAYRSEEHTSELQSPMYLVCRLLLEKKKQRSESQLQ